MQWHLTQHVGRTAQAGIEGADHGLHAIEHAICNVGILDEVARYLQDTAIHRQIVMAGSDDQIGRTDQAMLINCVVMDEGAAWRFGNSDALKLIWFGMRSYTRTQDIRFVEQFNHTLAGIEDLDEAGIMIEERTGASLTIGFQEFFPFTIGLWCATTLNHQEACQWADA